MTLFEEICNETLFLTESVSNTKINNAINGMHPVTIVYDDKQGGGGKQWRLIYPVAYGLTSAGNPVIRAYQTNGDSKRGLTTPPNNREQPKWKYFRVDRIKSWNMDKTQRFDGDDLIGFNEEGDDSMSVVYNIAPIGAAKQIHRQKKQQNQDKEFSNNKEIEIDDKPITKDDVNGIETTSNETEQPQNKYSAKQVINNLINRIKNSKIGNGVKNIFAQKNNNIQQNTIDNNQQNNNINDVNKLNAPDTKPIEKNDIKGTNQDIDTTVGITNNNVNDKPITKNDVNNIQDNELTRTFNDLTNRMNNLNKEQ